MGLSYRAQSRVRFDARVSAIGVPDRYGSVSKEERDDTGPDVRHTCLGLSPHDTTCPLRSEHAFRHVPMHRSMRAASRGTLIATSTASGRGVGAHGRAARFPGTARCQRHARCRHTRDVTLLPIVGCAPVPARCACRPRLRRFGLVERIAQCRFRDHRSTRPVMTVPLTPPIHPDRQASSYRTRSRGECRQKVEISIGTSRP